MPLNSRNILPPGGWLYEQKGADNRVLKKFASMSPFNDAAREILEFRKGNNLPRATLQEVADDLDEFQCIRLGFDPLFVSVKKNQTILQRFAASPSHVLQGVVGRAAGLVSNVVTGTQILADWLGNSGKPVSQELAQQRANVCILCEKNQDGHFSAKLTAAVANAILVQRRKKLEMKLTVEGEENLHTCSACDCHLPLKVWVPIDVVADRTSKETLKELPDFCWMKKEVAALKATPA